MDAPIKDSHSRNVRKLHSPGRALPDLRQRLHSSSNDTPTLAELLCQRLPAAMPSSTVLPITLALLLRRNPSLPLSLEVASSDSSQGREEFSRLSSQSQKAGQRAKDLLQLERTPLPMQGQGWILVN